ncbi:hypothetical protein EV175_004091 [Coemansia sp. RSA 1933]|nr:hypothetical protein EV175_004091 [Coemansia sp. RSA 1933]
MSTTLSIAYAQGRTVKVKATPMTTLQAVISEACTKIPNSAHPESYQLIHNKKTLDLSLPVRFANLPQGATLTLKRVASTGSSASPSSTSPQQRANGSRQPQRQLIKVALQVVGGLRIINEFESSATLWDIVYGAENGSQGTLNLTARYRDASKDGRASNGGPSSPLQNVQKAVLGSMQNLYRSVSTSGPSSPSSSASSMNQQQPVVAHAKQIYQQPVLQLPGSEVATFEAMQATTLRSLGYTSGQALIRLFFRDAPAPASLPPPPQPSAVAAVEPPTIGATPVQEQQTKVRPRTPDILPPKDEPAPATAAKKPTPETSTPIASLAPNAEPLVSRRQIQVFGSHTGSLSSPVHIELPESFYDSNSSSSDASLLIKAQRARLAEADRGFKMRSTEDKLKHEKHEKFKHAHPTTVVRFRFPDTTLIQATFGSTEKIDELFAFMRSIMGYPHMLHTLVAQPPLQDLGEITGTSLFDAKMTPAAVVHVRLLQDSATRSAALDLLRPEISALAQPLTDIDAVVMMEPADRVAENGSSNADAPAMASLAAATPQSNSSNRPAVQQQKPTTTARAHDGTKMPKWFLAGQKKH